jgi:acid phosphatase class B
MNIGLDYWQVCSHYPDYFRMLAELWRTRGANRVYILSAVGRDRIGTVQAAIVALNIPYDGVFEVVFDDPQQSPELKLAKCQELGITVFYDDREDVCRLLNKHGILALRVMRKDNSPYDIAAEQR